MHGALFENCTENLCGSLALFNTQTLKCTNRQNKFAPFHLTHKRNSNKPNVNNSVCTSDTILVYYQICGIFYYYGKYFADRMMALNMMFLLFDCSFSGAFTRFSLSCYNVKNEIVVVVIVVAYNKTLLVVHSL